MPQAYLSVAPYIATFAEYRTPLVEHLLQDKLRHWEKALRELAARALGALVPTDAHTFAGLYVGQLLQLSLDGSLEVRWRLTEVEADRGVSCGLAEAVCVCLCICGLACIFYFVSSVVTHAEACQERFKPPVVKLGQLQLEESPQGITDSQSGNVTITVDTVLQGMQVHHGAVLGLAEVILALHAHGQSQHARSHQTSQSAQLLSQHEGQLTKQQQLEVAQLLQKLQDAKFLRGKGGEVMKAATCRQGRSPQPHPESTKV